ncbi:Type III restriction system endonuclease [Rhodococcus sp. AW25M09]|uniref:restriction endonuclease n=1 Tax=Rhodococcus sp. AW25M09 TaxID=1268303 RepID=UPI0002ACF3CB|nr:DEAD/DEAH box helicase family protein [Rhodococcus sp. AW25M09]CCQ15629.1 Type III restriction system endonuclease [Rhodococcus sp. AW25M09]
MKFTFEADLDYQRDAIDAVTGLFKGQEALASYFTVNAHAALNEGLFEASGESLGISTEGYGNRLRVAPETILDNLRSAQNSIGLVPEPTLDSMNFTVEMETGTGKTYVYLRSIYELNSLYGFTKFVVVVPSVAINEGVAASVNMLREHFGTLYGNPPLQFFKYSGNNVSRLRSFATSAGIEIMIITVAAMNKATSKINNPSEDLDFEVPMDLIRATKPIVIVDEPQSVYGDDGNPRKKKGAGRLAVERMSPVATIRYSATHPKFDKGNLVYRLDAISAYEKQLVKQIEVDDLVTEGTGATPYVRLLSTKRTRNKFSARLELDAETATGIKRKVFTVGIDDNLGDYARRDLYRDLIVSSISVIPRAEHVRFTNYSEVKIGEAIGAEIGFGERARQMIAQTIRQHLRKEDEFALHGRKIKVLSLFFVDTVAKYRVYDENGGAQPGEYAQVFEEEYAKIASESEFNKLLGGRPAESVAAEAHQGYFSVDRGRGDVDRLVDTKETTDKGRQQAGLAYGQIMRDKVGLTTPGSPIRFIFSHSALQEGWDNPNVFQICVLRNMGSERWRRQSIGRGLRLCVDGDGNRVRGFDVNRLTVIANESYEEFAEQLQRELAEDLGIEFGVVTVDGFARITYKPVGASETQPIGNETGLEMFAALVKAGYIDSRGKVQDSLRKAVQQHAEELRRLVEATIADECGQVEIRRLINRIAKPIDVKKAGSRISVPVVQERLKSPEFQALWERIRHRTEFRMVVDETALRDELVKATREMPPVPKRKGEWLTYVVDRIDQSGLSAEASHARPADVHYEDSQNLPDILSLLADRTQLTRETIAHVLTDSGTLHQLKLNPQAYIDGVTAALNTTKARFLINGLKYDMVDTSRPESERRYPLSLLEEADLSGYTGSSGNIVVDVDNIPISFDAKSPYRYLVVDSGVEREFALRLQQRDDIKAFVKLPKAFLIPTPLGDYNPDWAVMAERPDGSQYIVFETKSKTDLALLRPLERGKILAARCHFDRVREDVGFTDLKYAVVDTMDAADAIFDHTADETYWAVNSLSGTS